MPPLVSQYGVRWARNETNIRALKDREGDPHGVYVLCDGSMPVYVGRGRIWRRVRGHQRSRTKGKYWDHFSWFAVNDKGMRQEVEALLLRMLPPYLRSLNKQRADFLKAKSHKQPDPHPIPIKMPKVGIGRRAARRK